MNGVARWLRRTAAYQRARQLVSRRRQWRELQAWEANGRRTPPPHIAKQRLLLEYARRYRLRVLVETGTYYGDMVEAMRRHFDRIYSIELSEELFGICQRRFAADSHVHLVHGDSATALGAVLRQIDEPVLFWLDGHFSGDVTARGTTDSPVREELAIILTARSGCDVILIDDARCFGRAPAYPSIAELTAFVREARPELAVEVEIDCIRITPPAPAHSRAVEFGCKLLRSMT